MTRVLQEKDGGDLDLHKEVPISLKCRETGLRTKIVNIVSHLVLFTKKL